MKGNKFFWSYFAMYMTVWVVGIIITFVFAGTKYFQDYFNGAIFGIGFFFSIALAAVLGIVPALILHNSKKKNHIYFCVLGFLLINLLAVATIGSVLKILSLIPVLYDLPFLLILDVLPLQNPSVTDYSFASNLFFLAILPTMYYFLLIWLALLLSHRPRTH